MTTLTRSLSRWAMVALALLSCSTGWAQRQADSLHFIEGVVVRERRMSSQPKLSRAVNFSASVP